MRAKISAAAGLVLLCACEFEEPKALPVDKYVGCYQASGAPDLNLRPDMIRIDYGPTVPFRIEMRKIGLVLATPLVGAVDGQVLTFSKAGEYYFYRLHPHGAGHSIQFVPRSGATVTYIRTSTEPCSVPPK
jgi:hypothetical protein